MKWMERIRRHWLLFMVAAFFLPLILIRVAFSDTLNSLFSLNAKWDAADMVSYCISYMSMVGTLFLGFATHQQGHMLNEIEQRMVKHTQLRALSERQPAVLLLNGKTTGPGNIPSEEVRMAGVSFDEDKLSLTAFLEDEPGDTFGLRLRVVNSSKTFLEMRCPVFSLFESKEYVKPVAHFGNEGFYVSLAPEEKLGITLKIGLTHKQMILEGYYRLTFELYNSIGERYVEQVRFVDSNTASRRQTEKSEADVIDTVAFGYKYFAYNYDEGRYDEL